VSTIFWDITPCSLVHNYRRIGAKYNLHLQDRRMSQACSKLSRLLGLFGPEDGGSAFFRNSTRLQAVTFQKTVSSYPSLWEHQISQEHRHVMTSPTAAFWYFWGHRRVISLGITARDARVCQADGRKTTETQTRRRESAFHYYLLLMFQA
jgi:hypothetical protein